MRKLILFLTLVVSVSAQDYLQRCIAQLKEDKEEIMAQSALFKAQVEAINAFVEKGPTVTLIYKDGKYYVRSVGEIVVWDKDKDRKIYPFTSAKFDKDTEFQFPNDNLNNRPHGYIGNVFKFGGVLLYSKKSDSIVPDISLMYEIFSFDKLLGTYGLSINAGVGIRHVSASLAYEFVHTKYFRNTSILAGYSYMFLDYQAAPFIGVSLNF